MLAGKLRNVPLQVLWANFVEGALVSALQHRPEGLDAVGVRHAPDVLGDVVVDFLVVEAGHAAVAASGIRIDLRARRRMVRDETLHGLTVLALYNLRDNSIGLAILRTHHHRLAGRAASESLAALGLRHILLTTANVGFIHFNRTVERSVAFRSPRFPNAMQHEPRRRLRHANVALQLHAGDRLQAGETQIDGDDPLAERYFRPLHRGARLHAEVGSAVRAPVWHLLVAGLAGALGTALRAVATVGPNNALEPRRRGFLSRKHVHQLNDGEAFAVSFSGCFLRHFRVPFLCSEYRGSR